MTLLAWQRAGMLGGRAVILLHGWASDAVRDWQDTGCVEALDRAGVAVYAPDLPGHAGSCDVPLPRAEPGRWIADTVLADLRALGVDAFAAVGHAEGALVAAHLALRAPERADALALISPGHRLDEDDRREVAAGLRDAQARVWRTDAAAAVAYARRDRRHDLPTLAQLIAELSWPAPARLGALRAPVLLAVAGDDAQRAGAPRLARLFHDARLATIPGARDGILSAPALHDAVVDFLA